MLNPQQQSELKRAALLTGVRSEAQSRIKKGMFDDASESKAEIEMVGAAIAGRYGGSIAQAPLKSEERASYKVAWDYDGDWYGIKDLARMSIVVPKQSQCVAVMNDLRREFSAAKGRGFVQEKIVTPESNPCGYSGMTGFVRTTNGRVAEVQINIPEIIYAKSSARTVRRILGGDAYERIVATTRMPGGLGHAFYEIWREPRNPADRDLAAKVSRRYYAYFRSSSRSEAERQWLLDNIEALKGRQPGAFAH